MPTYPYAGRVGIVVAIALLLVGGMLEFFSNGGLFHSTYTLDVLFDDGNGIDKGYPVLLSGVQVGSVDNVTLTSDEHVDVTVRINDKVRIPAGSGFTLGAPIFGGEPFVEITPPETQTAGFIPKNSVGLRGERTGDISATLAHANRLVDTLTETTRNVNALLGDRRLQESLRRTAMNAAAASASGARLANRLNEAVAVDNASLRTVLTSDNARLSGLLTEDNAQVRDLLKKTDGKADIALSNLDATTAQIRDITARNRGQLDAMIADMRDTTSSISGLASETGDAFKNGNVAANLAAAVSNLRETSDRLDSTVGHIESLTADPAVQDNLKQTTANLRDTTAQAKILLQRLNRLAGTHEPADVTPPDSPAIPNELPQKNRGASSAAPAPLILPLVDMELNTRTHRFRTDLDAYLPLGMAGAPSAFVRAGIFGVGDDSGLNLQYGGMLDRHGVADLRGGVYDSRLGAGADLGLGRRMELSVDAYDPNYFQLSARSVFMILPELGVLAGGDDLTRRPGAVFGLEYRRSK